MQRNLKEFIPKKIDQRDVFIEEVEDKYLIKCNKIRPPKPILIKQYLDYSEGLFEILGLYFGDGTNTNKNSGNRRVALANTSLELHKMWISFLEKLGIHKKQMYAQVQIRRETELNQNQLINYWSKSTKIPSQRFSNVSYKDYKTKKYGVLVVNFNSKIFRKIFENIFGDSLKVCNKNIGYNQAFLRGLFAAEGCVVLNQNKSLSRLDIPIKDQKRRTYVHLLFKQNKIQCTETDKRLLITGYINFRNAEKIKLAELHPEKQEKFNLAFKKLSESTSVPALTKIKIIQSLKSQPKHRFQIAQELNKSSSLIHKLLRDLEIKRIVKKEKKIISTGKKPIQLWKLIKEPKNNIELTKWDYKGFGA